MMMMTIDNHDDDDDNHDDDADDAQVIIGPMYLNAVSAMGVGTKPWKIVSPTRWCLMMTMGMMVFDENHDNDNDYDGV